MGCQRTGRRSRVFMATRVSGDCTFLRLSELPTDRMTDFTNRSSALPTVRPRYQPFVCSTSRSSALPTIRLCHQPFVRVTNRSSASPTVRGELRRTMIAPASFDGSDFIETLDLGRSSGRTDLLAISLFSISPPVRSWRACLSARGEPVEPPLGSRLFPAITMTYAHPSTGPISSRLSTLVGAQDERKIATAILELGSYPNLCRIKSPVSSIDCWPSGRMAAKACHT